MADLFSETPVIDPRNEQQLIQEAKLYSFQRSGGLIRANNIGSPLDVMIRSQAYVGSELLYYASQSIPSFVLKFLENTGATRAQGTKAVAPVTFTLTAVRPDDFYIPQNFQVIGTSAVGSFSYYVIEDSVIPAGSLSAVVNVQAKDVGSNYNLNAGAIKQYTQQLAFLQSVINLQPAAGGSNEESADQAIATAVKRLRLRNPVSITDFEEYAHLTMGKGSRAKCIPLLGLDQSSEDRGAVHVFLLSAGAIPATSAVIAQVRSVLEPRLMAGTTLNLSPMAVLPITLEIVAHLVNNATPVRAADNLWLTYQQYLNPETYPVGSSLHIDELAHRMRFPAGGGISYIEELYINDDTLPIGMPNAFTIPTARGLVARLTDESGNLFTELRGQVN